jgi:hypothetical protein
MGALNKFLIVLLLAGCSAKQTDVSKITKPAIQTAEEALDYAKNNIQETEDTRFLTAHLDACKNSLVSCEVSANQSLELKDREIKNRELMIIIAAVLAFIVGRALKA